MYRGIYRLIIAVCVLTNLLVITSGEGWGADRIITAVAGGGAFQANHGDNGPATSGYLWPAGITCDAAGNMYIADFQYNAIRKVDVATKIITTIAGTGAFGSSGDGGPATLATFSFPTRVAGDAGGNIYIADQFSGHIRKIEAATRTISTIANGGGALCLDTHGNLFFRSGNQIKEYNLVSGVVTVVAGSGSTGYAGDGGPAISASLGQSLDMYVNSTNDVYIADATFHVVRKVCPPHNSSRSNLRIG
ncbi:MAG: hypothetical protein H0X38_12455 [Planctomycetes bacterium]|nr:hypothetical protein [Planctomycetota bacterium]